MKTASKNQISNLVSYFKFSAYAHSDEIAVLAAQLLEEGDELDEVIQEILNDIEAFLEGYEYIECECQGSYYRHIWHQGVSG